MKHGLLILFLFLLLPAKVRAENGLVREPFEGVRPVGMGNAFIALSDDSNAIWYNPASLTEVQGSHHNLFDFSLGVDSLDTVLRLYNAVFNGDYNNLISEGTTYVRFDFKPTYIRKYFALSFFTRANGFWDIQQLQLPEADIYAFTDTGLAAAFGIPVTDYFSLGATIRGFLRSGVDSHVTVADLLASLGTIPDDFMAATFDYLKKLSGYGYGVGLNLGTLIKIPLSDKKGPRLRLAFTVEDVGNTSFTQIGTTPTPPSIAMNMNAGMALQYPIDKKSNFTLAYDMRHLFQPLSFVKTSHLGLEYRHKGFGLRGGLYQGYFTYGFSFEALPHTHVHFASYAAELGSGYHERSQRFWVLQAQIGFLPF